MINSDAQKAATQAQIDALNKQQQFVYNNLNPSTVNAQATQADIQQALAQLALQKQIDPAMAANRTAAENALLAQTQKIGVQSGQVGDQAVAEALAPNNVAANKQSLIDAALGDLKAGATLPPDVEAQLVQAGLEQSGMVTQGASASGIGGTIQRQILGTAGIQLQQARQQQAAQLLTTAQNLETSRANVLQSLFPGLAQTQLANLTGAGQSFGTANAAAPNVGLTGNNVANIWLARVGATNNITSQAGNALAQGAMAQGNIWGQALGGATRAAAPLINQVLGTGSPGYTTSDNVSTIPGTTTGSNDLTGLF